MQLLAVSPMPMWFDVCAADEIAPQTGACALVEGRQIALVCADGRLFAVDNFDPFSKAFVLSRGIVGDRGGRAKIASPIFKQSFDLETGVCLDDPQVAIAVYPTRIRDGRVEVCLPSDG